MPLDPSHLVGVCLVALDVLAVLKVFGEDDFANWDGDAEQYADIGLSEAWLEMLDTRS